MVSLVENPYKSLPTLEWELAQTTIWKHIPQLAYQSCLIMGIQGDPPNATFPQEIASLIKGRSVWLEDGDWMSREIALIVDPKYSSWLSPWHPVPPKLGMCDQTPPKYTNQTPTEIAFNLQTSNQWFFRGKLALGIRELFFQATTLQ